MLTSRLQQTLQRRTSRTAVLCTCGLLLVCSAAAADDDVELQGILPEFIPNRLTESDFAQLGDAWTEWGAATGRLVADFCTSEDAAVRGRQATLARLQERLSVVVSSLVDPQAGSDYGPLADLYGRLSRRVAVSAALLEILSASTDPQLRDVASSFLLAIEDYESE